MDRLIITRSLLSERTFIVLSEEERREMQYSKANECDIYKCLQEYENTGLYPEEISNLKSENAFLRKYIDELCHYDSASIEILAIKADNNRLHALIDDFESVLARKMGSDENAL